MTDWMQTFTGKAFYPLDPRPEDVDPIDIAHALSMLCRYGGHSKYFYSVAEHCVLISHHVESTTRDPGKALWGLLHDATEAYMGDMIRPLKRAMPAYSEAEGRLMDVICYRFNLSMDCPPEVKEADNRILQNERALLMLPPPLPWASVEDLDPLPGICPDGWNPRNAEIRFYERFMELT